MPEERVSLDHPLSEKTGDDALFNAKLSLGYVKLTINNHTVIEIDEGGVVSIVNSRDQLATARKASSRSN
ncbi:phage major tail tube protein [Chitinimonas sp. PSY-7]|uniref:phage major tail tube protein n=1 Tax=Chitinimonas sp. PSY-7 TaxID=3459088 RepID=UPI00403FF0E3